MSPRMLRSLERSLGLGRDPVRVDPGSARLLVEGGALLIDVRKSEDPGEPLAGAPRVTPEELGATAPGLDRDTPIVLACTCPAEWTSTRAAHWLRDRGFEAYAVTGGGPAFDEAGRGVARALPALSEEPDHAERATTLGALKHPRYRVYSVGVLLSLTGTWLASAA